MMASGWDGYGKTLFYIDGDVAIHILRVLSSAYTSSNPICKSWKLDSSFFFHSLTFHGNKSSSTSCVIAARLYVYLSHHASFSIYFSGDDDASIIQSVTNTNNIRIPLDQEDWENQNKTPHHQHSKKWKSNHRSLFIHTLKMPTR